MRAKTASKCPDAEASDNGVQPPPVDCLVAEKQIQKKQPKRHKGIIFEPKISMMRLGQVWSGLVRLMKDDVARDNLIVLKAKS